MGNFFLLCFIPKTSYVKGSNMVFCTCYLLQIIHVLFYDSVKKLQLFWNIFSKNSEFGTFSFFRNQGKHWIEDIFLNKNFLIADLASVTHDEYFKLNLFFSQLKNIIFFISDGISKVPDRPDPPHKWYKMYVYFLFQSFLITF